MIVVADASPFVGLIKIGHIDILPSLFGSVVIPPEIRNDLQKSTQAAAVRAFAIESTAWLVVMEPKAVEQIPDLDPGECAAISLAKELNADLLLIDEHDGREAAIARNLKTARTAALIRDAADVGLIRDLAEAFTRLKATNFRVPHKLLDQMLEQHLAQQR